MLAMRRRGTNAKPHVIFTMPNNQTFQNARQAISVYFITPRAWIRWPKICSSSRLELNTTDAIDLDGGGSTTMMVKQKVVNRGPTKKVNNR
jgi:hypothetical protein